ncbi:MAG: ATP-binding protein [Deltaproteobacteria bacterium]|nr:ATP-binding protein [Deltaproteobacteria bacterium]
MNDETLARLGDVYADGLSRWNDGDGEAALATAYDVGREALSLGLGFFELVSLHEAAAFVVRKGSPISNERLAEYLAEATAPFEMALRGYQETNQRLAAANGKLVQHNEELREAQRDAAAAHRELEAFSYRAAHDLRTPLNVVDGYAQLLLDDDATIGQREREWTAEIRSAVSHMQTLIHELLQLARAAGGDVKRERVDLSAIVRTVVARLRTATPDRRVEVQVPAGLVAQGDPQLLVIVLENLIGNAWKFTGRAEHPRIEIGSDGDAFFVRDNGAGFDMAHASRLFAPFQRLHTDDDFEGTGIGLATVARILQRHGGRIWAESAPDRGAAFFFTTEPSLTSALPLTPTPPPKP